MTNQNRLTRSRSDRVIAGVCGGLGRYFDVDPLIVRAVFVLLVFIPGPAPLIYLVLWLIMPQEDSEAPTQQAIKENFGEMREQAERALERAGLRSSRQQKPDAWRYDPYTGQPIQPQQDESQRSQDDFPRH